MTKERVCANRISVSRRTILASAPALAPILLTPAIAGSGEDPILPLYRTWLEARSEWRRLSLLPEHDNWETPEMLAEADREFKTMLAMIETRPTTIEGIAALSHVLWVDAGPSSTKDSPLYQEECEMIENRLMAALWRAASGQEGLPR